MYSYDYSDKLKKIIEKLLKKDKQLYEQLLKKINEVINSYSVESYKNLRYNLKNYKRVHVGHFVLIFLFDKSKNKISFEDFDHHDKIYRWFKLYIKIIYYYLFFMKID